MPTLKYFVGMSIVVNILSVAIPTTALTTYDALRSTNTSRNCSTTKGLLCSILLNSDCENNLIKFYCT